MSERYQREIEEILGQVGDPKPENKPKRGRTNPILALFSRVGRAVGDRVYLNPGRLMFTALALLLSAILVSAIVPGLIGPIVWVGLILFIMAYALFFARPGAKLEKRWRGRLLGPDSLPSSSETWWVRVKGWLRR